MYTYRAKSSGGEETEGREETISFEKAELPTNCRGAQGKKGKNIRWKYWKIVYWRKNFYNVYCVL